MAMKKLKDIYKSWRKGEEIEVLEIKVPFLIFLAIILFGVITICKLVYS
jgi:hypothetical protein